MDIKIVNMNIKIFFSQQSMNFLKTYNYPPESALKLLGRIESNFIRIDAIVPFNMVSQTNNSCSIAVLKEELIENVIGILHTHPNGNILPSDSDTKVMKELFSHREAAIFISEKKAGFWVIHPYIINENSKMTMLDSVTI